MPSKIPVLEIFGPTIQGEGRVIGRKTMFVRTAGCDYRCSWCDSAFTWDGSAKDDIELLTAQDIYDRLKEIGGNQFDHVTISGGNPALIKGIQDLVDLFEEKNIPMNDCLIRTKHTKPLSTLSPNQRSTMLSNCFLLSKNTSINLTNKKIALVDDIVTTQTTMQECLKILMNSFNIAKIDCISLIKA